MINFKVILTKLFIRVRHLFFLSLLLLNLSTNSASATTKSCLDIYSLISIDGFGSRILFNQITHRLFLNDGWVSNEYFQIDANRKLYDKDGRNVIAIRGTVDDYTISVSTGLKTLPLLKIEPSWENEPVIQVAMSAAPTKMSPTNIVTALGFRHVYFQPETGSVYFGNDKLSGTYVMDSSGNLRTLQGKVVTGIRQTPMGFNVYYQ